jgi:hypothetical protein
VTGGTCAGPPGAFFADGLMPTEIGHNASIGAARARAGDADAEGLNEKLLSDDRSCRDGHRRLRTEA